MINQKRIGRKHIPETLILRHIKNLSKKEQINLFPKTGTADGLYNITGRFKRKYKGLDLEVTEIIKTERQKILPKTTSPAQSIANSPIGHQNHKIPKHQGRRVQHQMSVSKSMNAPPIHTDAQLQYDL